MRVLHVVKTVVGATWAYYMVRVQCSLGIEVVVALPSDTEGLAPRYRECGARVIPVNLDFPTRQPWRLPAVFQASRELVEQVKPDLIHTHHVGTTCVLRLALGKSSPIPRVFRVAGSLHLEYWPFARAELALAGPRDYWIAINKSIRNSYLSLGVPPEAVFLSYTGIDLSLFQGTRTGKLRKELGLPAEMPLVGMVAYVYPPKYYLGQRRGVKGHEDFFATLCLVLKQRPDVRAVVVGGPWGNAQVYEKRLRAMGQKLCGSALTFTGFRTDVPEIYPDLDVAVLPSLSEGLPKAAAEALLSGVATVGTNVGGVPDLIRDGETGWLVPPRNPTALAQAILEVLANPEEARRRTLQGRKLV
ncbi:MAG: glycosyltransferase, partial [Acidobacteriota bacterium]